MFLMGSVPCDMVEGVRKPGGSYSNHPVANKLCGFGYVIELL